MRSRPKSESINPRPVMPRSDEPFEEKWLEAEFEIIFKQIANAGLSSIKETHELAFRSGYFSGKRKRDLSQTKVN